MTRFSLYQPASSAWYLAQGSEEDYYRKLYDPKRMKDRIDIFIKRALPIYEIMSRGLFYRHLISYSVEMPLEYVRHLELASKKYPFLILQQVDSKGQSENFFDKILHGKPNGTVAIFRVDDDDLLSREYLHHLSRYANSQFHGMVVSFGRGYAAQYSEGRFSNFKEEVSRFIAIGQCYIVPWLKNSNQFSQPKIYSHNNIDNFLPTISDCSFYSYVHTHHLNQDSNSESDRVEVLRSDIHPKLLGLKSPNNYADIGDMFPAIKDDAMSASTGIDVIYDHSIHLDRKPIFLNVNIEPSIMYEVQYQLNIGSGIGLGRGALFSISHEGGIYQEDISGLTLSAALGVGFYKYLASGGMGRGSFSFIVPKSYENLKVSIFPWESKMYSNCSLDIKLSKLT